MTAALGGETLASYGTDWLYLVAPVVVLAGAAVYLFARGKGDGPIDRVANSLESITGTPAWCGGGVAVGSAALVIALVGFMWDVAWHIDMGRDEFLFTPPHLMIVVGLGLLVMAAVTSIVFATRARASVGFSIGDARIPYGALCVGVLGFGALCGFPLDELWHGAYGVDVTMWGPTHLLMIGGASFSPIALWLLLTEAGPEADRSRLVRVRRIGLAVAVLIGLSTFQGEFDFGVPQFQQLYHPMLVALAASIALVAAREALGPGGALKAAAGFIAARGFIALFIGEALNRVVPRFPLYLGAAVAVEVVAYLARRLPLPARALLAGLGIATVGLASEWAWTHAWGWHQWGSTLWPAVVAAGAIALPGAVIGAALGGVLSFRAPNVAPRFLVTCAAVVVALLVVPYPRTDAKINGRLSTTPAGTGRVDLALSLEPGSGITDADWFEVLSWQGGAMQITALHRERSGVFAADDSVPVGGEWKSLVRIARKDVMVGAPVYLPPDPAIGASEVPVVPERPVEFTRDTELLLREAHSGPRWPAIAAYISIGLIACGWIGVLALSYNRVGRAFAATRRAEEKRSRTATATRAATS